jgi:hypothetical protein
VDVRVETTSCDDATLASNHIRTGADNHLRVDSIHDIRVACLANANNEATLDADVCLEDAGPVDDERIRNDSVQTLGI